MVEVAVGIILSMTIAIIAFAWFGVSSTEKKIKAEEESERLRLGKVRREAADEVMRESIATPDIWRQRTRLRLRDTDYS